MPNFYSERKNRLKQIKNGPKQLKDEVYIIKIVLGRFFSIKILESLIKAKFNLKQF